MSLKHKVRAVAVTVTASSLLVVAAEAASAGLRVN